MKAAPYTTTTLTRTRNGATAGELGWDAHFYLTVCRHHELIPVAMPAPKPEVTTAAPPPRQVATGDPVFNAVNQTVHRGRAKATLNLKQSAMLVALAELPASRRFRGVDLAERIGIGESNISSYVNKLRTALEPVNVYVLGTNTRASGSGYRLVDAQTREPITVGIVSSALDKKQTGATG